MYGSYALLLQIQHNVVQESVHSITSAANGNELTAVWIIVSNQSGEDDFSQ